MEDTEEKKFEEWKKDYIKKIKDEANKDKRDKDLIEGCIKRILPVDIQYLDNFFNDLKPERIRSIRQTFALIDKLYINIREQKRRLMIVKGLFKAHYNCNNTIVVLFTLLVACANLIMASLQNYSNNDGDQIISNNVFQFGDIVIGVVGIFIAFFAKLRDQKEDLTHNLLTVLNQCNIFLMKCEKYILDSIIQNIQINDYRDEEVVEELVRRSRTVENDMKTSRSNYLKQRKVQKEVDTIQNIDDLQKNYPDIMQKCEDVINTFSSEESIVLINGPVYYNNCFELCCHNRICKRIKCNRFCILYDPEYVKDMLGLENQNNQDVEHILKDNEVELVIRDEDDRDRSHEEY